MQGFKRLIDVDLELRPLNVLIGANGKRKTSLLEVFSSLGSFGGRRAQPRAV